jgi:hypothetical protein
MTMKEKLHTVRRAICLNRREIAHTCLEAVAGADNPFSLIAYSDGITWPSRQEEQSSSRGVHLWK